VFRETEIDRVPDANKAGLGPGAASQLTHHMLQKFQVEQQSLVRFHMAKEFSALPACWRTCATRSATRLQELQPVGPLAVREAIDPQRTFLNLYLTQLFQDEQPDTYTPPNNLPMRPQGIMDESEDWLTLREQLKPHLPLRAINEVHSRPLPLLPLLLRLMPPMLPMQSWPWKRRRRCSSITASPSCSPPLPPLTLGPTQPFSTRIGIAAEPLGIGPVA